MADQDRGESPKPQGELRLVTLGGASLRCVPADGEMEEILDAGKPFALVVYLASSPGGSATRDHLTDLLWANLDLDSARHALRQALWYLRKRLGQQAIRSRNDSVVLSVPLEFDRNRFLAAIEAGDLERAVGLYRGEFLPVFAAPGGARFEKWTDVERYRLKTHFHRAVETLVQRRLSEGAFHEARELAFRARDIDPHDQNTWRLVLESLLTAGDRVRAQIEAHAFGQRLDELQVEPEPALRELLEAARSGGPRPLDGTEDGGLEPELVGREQEFAAVLSAWRASRSGRGSHVHVVGTAGVGKSRLLAELEDRLDGMGARIVGLRAHPGERQIHGSLASELAASLSGLRGGGDVADGTAAILVGLDPSLTDRYGVEPADSTGDEALRRRAVALRDLLGAVTGGEPLALLVDDLHWADRASRQLLVSLLEKSSDLPLLFVTTARPGARTPSVTVGRTEVLRLEPLTEEELARLLSSAGTLPEAPWARDLPAALYAATGGSPLLVLETLRLALEEGSLVLEEGSWRCGAPERLEEELAEGRALERRVERLPREKYGLLALLCVSGRPMGEDLLETATEAAKDAVVSRLCDLEVEGLVARVGDAWAVAHDEIAAAVTGGMAEAVVREAHRAVGRALAAVGGDVPQTLERAGRHLSAAADVEGLERLFPRWVAAVRDRGDPRPAERLAADLAGEEVGTPVARRLVRALPLRMRLGFGRRWKTAAAALVLGLALGVAGVLVAGPRAAPDATLYVFRPSPDGTVSGHALPISGEDLEPGSTLDVDALASHVSGLKGLDTRHLVLPDPSGERWAYVRTVADSGDYEVYLVDADGSRRRLTYAPGDDAPTSWSPDGRQLIVVTSRWDRYNWHDLAILDVETGGVTQLTSGHDDEQDGLWSPDGTRIAFRRTLRGPEPFRDSGSDTVQVCWTTVDGATERCSDLPGRTVSLKAWRGSEHLLAHVTDSTGERSLRLLDLEGREIGVVDTLADRAVASPTGRWVASLRGLRDRSSDWHVFRTDRPRRAVTLTGIESPQTLRLAWGRSRRAPLPLDRLEIRAPDTVALGVPVQLRAYGFDSTGRLRSVPVVTWTVEGYRAAVDARSGVLRPLRTGSVTLRASAGGWREAAAEIDVVEPVSRTMAREDWSGGTMDAWVPFGDPRPETVRDSTLGPALWVHGDGVFYSGVHSRREFDPIAGLGLRATVSTPRTGPRAQKLSVGFWGWRSPEPLGDWDRRTGGLPEADYRCAVTYPVREGFDNLRQLRVGPRMIEVDAPLGSGRPYSLTVQLFRDGTCGVALDGSPIARTAAGGGGLSTPRHVVLQGKSLGTRMLVGELEVWRGVRDDVDWSGLEGWSVREGR